MNYSIVETLKTGMHVVTFRKKDGTLRSIRGYLPDWAVQKTPDTCPIWDEDEACWKSFRLDSVVSVAGA